MSSKWLLQYIEIISSEIDRKETVINEILLYRFEILFDDYFKKMYKVNENHKTTIEIYSNDSKIEFYIPLSNLDKFFVYRMEDKSKNE